MIPKKKVFTKIETVFSPEIGNSNGFSAQEQVISKKKKNSSPKLGRFFSADITATPSQLRLPNPFGEGLLSFFEQKSASTALKTCDFAYFSGQWGSSSSPPGYDTGWSCGNAFVSGTGLRFKFPAGKIRHNLANCLPSLRHFLERSFVAWAQ